MNATIRIVVTSLAALALWLSGAGIAVAHTTLSKADPTADARLSSAPTAITLTFSEAINSTFVNVVLTSADGRNWLSGDPRVDGPRVSATVRSEAPPPGLYTVGYRVVSADGHPVSGSYTFTIVGVPGSVPPPSANAAPTTSAATPAEAPAGADTRTSVITAAVVGLALGGVIAFWQSRKHRRRNGYDTRPADPPSPGDESAER